MRQEGRFDIPTPLASRQLGKVKLTKTPARPFGGEQQDLVESWFSRKSQELPWHQTDTCEGSCSPAGGAAEGAAASSGSACSPAEEYERVETRVTSLRIQFVRGADSRTGRAQKG